MARHLRAISANQRARVSVVSNGTLSGVYGKEPCIKKALPTARSLRCCWLLCRGLSQCGPKQALIKVEFISLGPGLHYARPVPKTEDREPIDEVYEMTETVGAFAFGRLHASSVCHINGFPGNGINYVLSAVKFCQKTNRVISGLRPNSRGARQGMESMRTVGVRRPGGGSMSEKCFRSGRS